MATEAQLIEGLQKADAAGNTADAQAFADAIKSVRASTPPAMPEGTQVSSPEQNWSNVGAESLSQAGIKPMLTDSERMKARLITAVPFNLGDEAAASLASTKDRFTPKEQPAYDAALSSARDVQKRYSADSPVESVAMGIPSNVAASSMLPGGPIAQGALSGAMQGFGGGEGGLGDRARRAAVGGAVGAGTSAILSGAGKALSQPKVNPDVQLLQNEGLKLTPGQIVGGIGKKTEDIATSIPVMGDLIAKRQGESLEGLNRAVANRALDEIGGKLPDGVAAGRDTVSYVRKAMTDSYSAVLSQMQAVPDVTFSARLQTAKAAAAALPKDQLSQFNKIINSEIFDKVAKNSGVLDGDAIKGIESTLTSEIKGYSSGGWNEQKLAAALTNAKSAFRDMITRQNPNVAPALEATDRAYANYAILRKAGGAVGNDNGVFTPAQLLSAVKGSDASAGKGNFASGTSRMQDLADAAKNVLPSKVPDSGTARRVMQGGVLSTLGTGAYLSGNAVPAAVGVGVGSALYTTPGQKLAAALLSGQRPQGVAAAGSVVQKASPKIAALAAYLASRPN